MQEGQVGPKGELIPPKEIMDKSDLHPRTKVSLREVLQRKPVVEITLDEAKRFRKELSKKAET